MSLITQIDEEKRKSHLIGDFVIDAMYIRTLAPSVLSPDEEDRQGPSFQETCDTLRILCNQVMTSIQTLRNQIPVIPVSCQNQGASFEPLEGESLTSFPPDPEEDEG